MKLTTMYVTNSAFFLIYMCYWHFTYNLQQLIFAQEKWHQKILLNHKTPISLCRCVHGLVWSVELASFAPNLMGQFGQFPNCTARLHQWVGLSWSHAVYFYGASALGWDSLDRTILIFTNSLTHWQTQTQRPYCTHNT